MTSLLLLIVTARLLGELGKHWGQPALVGELFSGILLGPALLGLLKPTPELGAVSNVAVFLIVLAAGMKTDLEHVMRGFSGAGVGVLLLNFFLPLAGGIALGTAFHLGLQHTLVLGICISITALPVAVRLLDKLGLLHSLTARYALSAAVTSDILALLILGALLGLGATSDQSQIAQTVGLGALKLAALAAALALAYFGLKRLQQGPKKLEARLDALAKRFGPESIFSLAVLFVLAFASLSELLSFPAVIGAFFGALLLQDSHMGPRHFARTEQTASDFSEGFLGPVFFGTLGLHFSNSAFSDLALIGGVLAVSILSKLLAGGLGGRLAGMSTREAWGLGAILNGRGVMELVVAEVAYEHGLVDASLFSVLLLMGTVTTMLAPLLYGRFVPPPPKKRRA